MVDLCECPSVEADESLSSMRALVVAVTCSMAPPPVSSVAALIDHAAATPEMDVSSPATYTAATRLLTNPAWLTPSTPA
jgi:hypothetical protein